MSGERDADSTNGCSRMKCDVVRMRHLFLPTYCKMSRSHSLQNISSKYGSMPSLEIVDHEDDKNLANSIMQSDYLRSLEWKQPSLASNIIPTYKKSGSLGD